MALSGSREISARCRHLQSSQFMGPLASLQVPLLGLGVLLEVTESGEHEYDLPLG